MSEPRVVVTVEDHVAHVRLHRPDKRNGLDLPMFEALVEAGEGLAADPRVRSVVLSGDGPAFCAGLDWMAFLAMGPDASARLMARDPAGSPANLAQRVCWIWAELPMPVVAAVHGVAFGGGLQLALGCDVRLVTRDAQLSVMEVRYGLIPDMSATQTLLRLVRPDVAKELMFTGRVFSGEEAVQLGLATRVVDDPVAAALALARTIAGHSPHAVRAAKALASRAPMLSPAEGLALEAELQLTLLGSPNQLEAVQATMTRRAPVFSDPG